MTLTPVMTPDPSHSMTLDPQSSITPDPSHSMTWPITVWPLTPRPSHSMTPDSSHSSDPSTPVMVLPDSRHSMTWQSHSVTWPSRGVAYLCLAWSSTLTSISRGRSSNSSMLKNTTAIKYKHNTHELHYSVSCVL
jgi:hypothetical protein